MKQTIQYLCENSMWILFLLTFTYRVIIDIFINAPGRVRSKIYGISGSDKSYLNQTFA